MKKTIRDFDLKDKKVIIRCDFNVPIENGIISDNYRVIESLPTIKYAIDHNAKIIILSHFGRITDEIDKQRCSLEKVALELERLLKKEVSFISSTKGDEVEVAINNLKPGEIVMLENTRFEDLDNKKESTNNEELSKYWASLGDIFINDAFGNAHREHASNAGISLYLPSGMGLLLEKEINILNNAVQTPKRPFVVILGGAKVKEKIEVIKNLVDVADKIIICGGIMYTFIKAMGYEIGNSILDKDNIEFCKKILEEHKDKIFIPKDVIAAKELSPNATIRVSDIDKIVYNETGLDIGPETIREIKTILQNSETVIWNGPVGYFEYDKFANGTKKILEILSKIDANVIIGGGDSASAAIKFGYKDKFTRISTGGGAVLMFLEGKELPGLKNISSK